MTTHPAITLVLGGARSGKSSFAEKLVLKSALQPVYLATAQALDHEMHERIAHHRQQRGAMWQTVEEPIDLVSALMRHSTAENHILVDCLTLWITNLMMQELDIATQINVLIEALPKLAGPVVFVSNEVGLGIVPDNRLSREFRDQAGFLHQKVAAIADEVYFMAAGLSLKMKG
ncbi:bifunctional adenosylcobinamide kinase/adenosylcobinamide-phosphate guanylyltransferase [Daeguia caeni]|uniref:Bifunctional adenosylcobalamin biosynthesis protein n=1 Tax=Daeguia caeni TaxID=439612 RepID=A0ABV9H3W7_9HYPH